MFLVGSLYLHCAFFGSLARLFRQSHGPSKREMGLHQYDANADGQSPEFLRHMLQVELRNCRLRRHFQMARQLLRQRERNPCIANKREVVATLVDATTWIERPAVIWLIQSL